jgi:hypothetical protein
MRDGCSRLAALSCRPPAEFRLCPRSSVPLFDGDARHHAAQDYPNSNHLDVRASPVPLWDGESILRRNNCLEEVAG